MQGLSVLLRVLTRVIIQVLSDHDDVLEAGLEQNILDLQYIAILNPNPVLEWPQRLHSGLKCSAMIAIMIALFLRAKKRIQLLSVRCVFRLIRIITLKAD